MAKLVPQSHPALHTIAEEVAPQDISSARIQKVLKDMRTALRSYDTEGYTGVAIAAPQIGVPLRIFLVEDMSTEEERKGEARLPSLVAINPRIVKLSKKKHLASEGCLSVQHAYGNVERATNATIRAYDEHGNEYERGAGGLLAQIFQHEVDHLDGILFVDRAKEVFYREPTDETAPAAESHAH